MKNINSKCNISWAVNEVFAATGVYSERFYLHRKDHNSAANFFP
jgi:hypothetical protein